MSVLKRILLGLLVLAVLLVLVGFFLPSRAHVERSTTIEAPPATVFALVNGFRSFNKWSPWAARDPQTEYQYQGPDSGVGAKMSWTSQNPQVGSGSQVIKVSQPLERVESHLDFGSQGTATAFFLLLPTDGGTAITWGFDTDFGMNLVSRYMGLMFDSWIGGDYEVGLANLKRLAESLPQGDWTNTRIELLDLDPMTIVSVAGSSSWDASAIGQALGEAFGQIDRFMRSNGLEFAGQPVAITTSADEAQWEFDAGIPIAEVPDLEIDPASPVQIRLTPGGKTVRGASVGSYVSLSANWDKVRAWAAAHGYEEAGQPWEEYVSDPGETSEEELITHLYMPVK